MEKRFYWLYVTVFINILAFGMVFPILPLFAKSYNATSFQIGLLYAVFSLSQFIFAPFMGKLSDRFGRKKGLLLSITIVTLALLLIGVSKNLTFIFIGMFLQGLGSSGVLPGALAYIADVTSGHSRSKYISRVTGTFALGFMVGPGIGGLIGDKSLSEPFLVAAVISFINLISIYFLLSDTKFERDKVLVLREGLVNFKPILKELRGHIGTLLVVLFAWAFYIANFSLSIPLFTQERFGFSSFQVGLFFSFVGFVAGVTQWFILPVIERAIGDKRVIFYGLIFLIAGHLLVPLSVNAWIFYAVFTITVLGSALTRPSVNSMISKKTTEGQGSVMGVAFSVESLGRVLGPIILGYSIVLFNTSVPFMVTTVVLVLSFLYFYQKEFRNGQS